LLTDFAIKIKPSYNGKKYETNLTTIQEMYKSDKKQIFFKTKVNRKTVYAVKYVNLPSLYEFMRQTNCELYEVIFDGQLINLYFDFDIVDDVKREDLLIKILKIFKTIFENKKIYYLTNYRAKDDKIKSSFHIHIPEITFSNKDEIEQYTQTHVFSALSEQNINFDSAVYRRFGLFRSEE